MKRSDIKCMRELVTSLHQFNSIFDDTEEILQNNGNTSLTSRAKIFRGKCINTLEATHQTYNSGRNFMTKLNKGLSSLSEERQEILCLKVSDLNELPTHQEVFEDGQRTLANLSNDVDGFKNEVNIARVMHVLEAKGFNLKKIHRNKQEDFGEYDHATQRELSKTSEDTSNFYSGSTISSDRLCSSESSSESSVDQPQEELQIDEEEILINQEEIQVGEQQENFVQDILSEAQKERAGLKDYRLSRQEILESLGQIREQAIQRGTNLNKMGLEEEYLAEGVMGAAMQLGGGVPLPDGVSEKLFDPASESEMSTDPWILQNIGSALSGGYFHYISSSYQRLLILALNKIRKLEPDIFAQAINSLGDNVPFERDIFKYTPSLRSMLSCWGAGHFFFFPINGKDTFLIDDECGSAKEYLAALDRENRVKFLRDEIIRYISANKHAYFGHYQYFPFLYPLILSVKATCLDFELAYPLMVNFLLLVDNLPITVTSDLPSGVCLSILSQIIKPGFLILPDFLYKILSGEGESLSSFEKEQLTEPNNIRNNIRKIYTFQRISKLVTNYFRPLKQSDANSIDQYVDEGRLTLQNSWDNGDIVKNESE